MPQKSEGFELQNLLQLCRNVGGNCLDDTPEFVLASVEQLGQRKSSAALGAAGIGLGKMLT